MRIGPTSCFQAVKTKLSHRTLKQRHELGSNCVLYTYMHSVLAKCQCDRKVYTEYLVIKKETLSPKSPKFPFSLHFFPSTVLSERFHFCTHQLFPVFLYNFAREICAWPAKIDPGAHARCLTVALSYFQGEWLLDTSIASSHEIYPSKPIQMEAEVHASRVGALKKHRLACLQSQKDGYQFATPSATFTHLVVVRACLKYSAR